MMDNAKNAAAAAAPNTKKKRESNTRSKRVWLILDSVLL